MAIRNQMFSEIQSRLLGICQKRFLKRLPVKYVNTHRRQIAAGIRRFLLEIRNSAAFVGNHDAEALCFLHGNRHYCDSHLSAVLLVEVKHHLIIHLINMIAGKNQHILRVVRLHIGNILIYRIRRAGVPLAIGAFLIGRQYRNAADVPVKIPGNTDTDMRIQSERLILRKHANRVNAGINAVTQREIYDPVLTSKRYSRLGHL